MSAAQDERATQVNLLRESAVDFVRRNTDFKAYRARREKLPGYEPAQLRQMAELGWFGMLVPEAHGGAALGLTELAAVAQALSQGLLAEPLTASTVLAGRVLARAPESQWRNHLLSGLVDASTICALAWQEGMGDLDPALNRTRASANFSASASHAQATGGELGVRLNGTKRLVVGAAGAHGFLITAQPEKAQSQTPSEAANEIGLYWISADAPGLSKNYEWRADGTPVGLLELNNVWVGRDHIIAPPEAATLANIERTIDEAAVIASAELLGVMEATLQMTLAYMRTRVQFGKPIGSFQALQHKATDLYVQQELSRAVLAEALQLLDSESVESASSSKALSAQTNCATERALVASRCKSRCSDAGLRITREAIQLHGAIGFTDEYDVGLFLKRALVLSAWLGNSSAHRRRFAALSFSQAGE